MKGLVKSETPRDEDPQPHIDCTGDLQVTGNSLGFVSARVMFQKSASLFGVSFNIFIM